ncbi:MAG: T9SS type A sorting domain-containing protein [Bacteroidales bacterium]
MKMFLALFCFIIPGFFHGLFSQSWTPLPDPGHGGQIQKMIVNQDNGEVTLLAIKQTSVANHYVMVISKWDGNQWVTGTPSDSALNAIGTNMMVVTGDSVLVPFNDGLQIYSNQQWSFRSYSGPAPCVPFYLNAIGWFDGHLYASGVFYEKRPDSTWNKTNPAFLAYLDDTTWIPIARFKGGIYQITADGSRLYLCGYYRDTITNTWAGLGYLDGQMFHSVDSTISCIDFVKVDDGYYLLESAAAQRAIYHCLPSGLTELTSIRHLAANTFALAWFDHKLIFAGCFDDTAAGGVRFSHIAAIDSAGNLFRMQEGFNGLVSDLGHWNNILFASGTYTMADNKPAFGIASWTGSIAGISDIIHQDQGKPYPNPASGIIHIPVDGPDGTIEVYTLTGTQVFRQEAAGLSGSHRQLDLSSLSPGMYLVVSNGKGASKSWKVVLTD